MKKLVLIALIAAFSLVGSAGMFAQGDYLEGHYAAVKYLPQEEHPDPT